MCIGLDEWAGARGNSWESNKKVFWNEREMGRWGGGGGGGWGGWGWNMDVEIVLGHNISIGLHGCEHAWNKNKRKHKEKQETFSFFLCLCLISISCLFLQWEHLWNKRKRLCCRVVFFCFVVLTSCEQPYSMPLRVVAPLTSVNLA